MTRMESIRLSSPIPRSRIRPELALAVCLVALELILGVFGPWLAPYPPTAAEPSDALLSPSWSHPFGTNVYGADVLSRVLTAARLDLEIAVLSVALAFAIGAPLGAAVGYSTSWIAGVVMRFFDFVQSFPVFILAMALVAASGPSARNVIAVLAILNIPIFVRLVRSEVLAMSRRTFVEAARVSGNTDASIVFRHLLPNSVGSSISQASVSVGWALLLTAGLSFVGAGVQPPTPEWGLMISEGAQSIATGEWWISVFPGLALGLAVLAFACAGELVAKALDVRRRSMGANLVAVDG
jgi:peptide/nickel transport system permease protein